METQVRQLPVVKIDDDEVYPLQFTPATLNTFWEKARQFPTIYGHEIVNNSDAFVDLFFNRTERGLVSKGLFWVLNDFTGIFYLTNIREEKGELIDALVHYTFFDKRHHGRVPLVRAMLNYVFEKYKFIRLSAEIPNYTTPQARHFVQQIGMSYEGKKRNAALYKGEWYSVNLYGILRSELKAESPYKDEALNG